MKEICSFLCHLPVFIFGKQILASFSAQRMSLSACFCLWKVRSFWHSTVFCYTFFNHFFLLSYFFSWILTIRLVFIQFRNIKCDFPPLKDKWNSGTVFQINKIIYFLNVADNSKVTFSYFMVCFTLWLVHHNAPNRHHHLKQFPFPGKMLSYTANDFWSSDQMVTGQGFAAFCLFPAVLHGFKACVLMDIFHSSFWPKRKE